MLILNTPGKQHPIFVIYACNPTRKVASFPGCDYKSIFQFLPGIGGDLTRANSVKYSRKSIGTTVHACDLNHSECTPLYFKFMHEVYKGSSALDYYGFLPEIISLEHRSILARWVGSDNRFHLLRCDYHSYCYNTLSPQDLISA